MDKKSAQSSEAETKLVALGAAKAPEKDPLADAKRAFEDALKKTNDGQEAVGEEKIVVEAVAHKEKPKPEAKKPEAVDHSKVELEKLRRELAEVKEKLPTPPKPEPEASDFDAVQAHLAEQFGEEESAILIKSFKALIAPRENRIASLEQMIHQAIEKSNVSTAKANRARLSKEYSHLGESDKAWEMIDSQAKALMGSGDYDTPDAAFDAVVAALYGEAKAKAADDAEEEASRIAASTPTQPGSARRERKLTNDQKSRAIFDHLVKNPDDAAGAKRLARELRAYE
jgi:hypothetical protein